MNLTDSNQKKGRISSHSLTESYIPLTSNEFCLANGIRVVHKFVPYTRAVHCGFVLDNGSRDDLPTEAGMAHFIEHMIFKGTTRRKTFHVLNYLESVGGDLNAYTTKEKTCIYASIMSEFFGRATELLADILFNSTFPNKEIGKERQVIAEEIEMYRNTPDEAIFEDFDLLIFPEHGLGHPILGYKESIDTFTREKLWIHMQQAVAQQKVVYAIVGNVTEKEVLKVIDKYLADKSMPERHLNRERPLGLEKIEKDVSISTNQAHEILGGRAYAMREGHYKAFILLMNLLGGPGMNSRLNLNVREKHGLTYNINSFYVPYTDAGLWGIYYGCETANLERVRKLVGKEIKSLREKPLGTVRLSQAKKQLMGQMTLAYENLLHQMLSMAKDLLDFNKIPTFSEYMEEIEAIEAKHIQEAANEILDMDQLSRIAYKNG